MESIVQKSSILGDEDDAFVRWRHGNGDGACVNEMLRTDCAHTYQIFVVNARAAARKNTTPFHECLAMSGYRHAGSCHGRQGTRVNVLMVLSSQYVVLTTNYHYFHIYSNKYRSLLLDYN